jgi:hypothetical protein
MVDLLFFVGLKDLFGEVGLVRVRILVDVVSIVVFIAVFSLDTLLDVIRVVGSVGYFGVFGLLLLVDVVARNDLPDCKTSLAWFGWYDLSDWHGGVVGLIVP